VCDRVISYIEMCHREATSLQGGMNFGLGGNHSVILMSVRSNAPKGDRLRGYRDEQGIALTTPAKVDQKFAEVLPRFA